MARKGASMCGASLTPLRLLRPYCWAAAVALPPLPLHCLVLLYASQPLRHSANRLAVLSKIAAAPHGNFPATASLTMCLVDRLS